MQHVRPRAGGERLALLDAEAMLLVDDRNAEVAEADARLDERVRADDHGRLSSLLAVALPTELASRP